MKLSLMNKELKYLTNPSLFLHRFLLFTARIWNDEVYLKMKYRLEMGKKLNLKHPVLYTEKLQWIKLHDHRSLYTTMVDKYAVKDYVAGIIGWNYIIPTLGVWENPDDIAWDLLPDQFVLKCTHDSGTAIIVKDKGKLDIESITNQLRRLLRRDYFLIDREWPYKNVPRRVIVEQYIESSSETGDLPDYKFFCFDGNVRAMFVATERQNPDEEVKFDFFDADYNHLPLRQGHDNAVRLPQKPHNFELMKQLAAQLSRGIPHVRVDFYDLGDKVLFGELTLFHFSGLVPFEPEEWDIKFGNWIHLPIDE